MAVVADVALDDRRAASNGSPDLQARAADVEAGHQHFRREGITQRHRVALRDAAAAEARGGFGPAAGRGVVAVAQKNHAAPTFPREAQRPGKGQTRGPNRWRCVAASGNAGQWIRPVDRLLGAGGLPDGGTFARKAQRCPRNRQRSRRCFQAFLDVTAAPVRARFAAEMLAESIHQEDDHAEFRRRELSSQRTGQREHAGKGAGTRARQKPGSRPAARGVRSASERRDEQHQQNQRQARREPTPGTRDASVPKASRQLR